jgi:hypothetical protein
MNVHISDSLLVGFVVVLLILGAAEALSYVMLWGRWLVRKLLKRPDVSNHDQRLTSLVRKYYDAGYHDGSVNIRPATMVSGWPDEQLEKSRGDA